MVKYKIIYWHCNDVKVCHIEAHNVTEAVVLFYLNYPCDDLIRIEVADV